MTHYWFISTTSRRGMYLALITFALAFVVIMLGAFTRLTNAGLSCPDWPNCFGYLTAPHTMTQLQEAAQRYPMMPINVTKAWTEMTHRYFAGTEGILILILALSIFSTRKITAIALVSFLSIQILLGMLTVTAKLKPIIVLAHLLTGLSILSLLWWTFLDAQKPSRLFAPSSYSRFTPWLWLGLLIVAAQITLGGWVSTHYAGLACIDFPYCNGLLLPTMQWRQLNSDLITIHMLHRFGAMITATYLGLLAISLMRRPFFRSAAILILALLTLQITLGVLNIIWLRPVWIALIHHAVAICLLLTMIMILVNAYRDTHA